MLYVLIALTILHQINEPWLTVARQPLADTMWHPKADRQ
jgi:hypothetical protein